MCSNHRLAHPDEAVAQSVSSHALRGHARAFQQQKQFVRQHFGLSQFGSGAQVDDPLTLRGFERLDYAPRRVILVRKLDRGVRERAASLVTTATWAAMSSSHPRS